MHHFLNKKNLSESVLVLGLFAILALAALAVAEEPETKEPFYKNVSANIEMRLVIESDEDKTPWLYMQDLEGTPHKVSEEILIDSSDVEGAAIRKEYGEDTLILYYRPTSWKKVFEVTTRVKDKRVAMVKEGEIITTPVVLEPLFRLAGIAGGPLSTAETLLKGFVLHTRPPHLDSKKLYHQFLSDRLATKPNDLELMETLAYSYLQDKESPQFEKALPLLEELARAQPQDLSINSSLVNCYVNLGKLEEALKTARQAISYTQPPGHTGMYLTIGEIHFLLGYKDLALQNLEHALKSVEEMEFPNIDELSRKVAEFKMHFIPELVTPEEIAKINKEFGSEAPFKNKMIKDIQNIMEYIRTH